MIQGKFIILVQVTPKDLISLVKHTVLITGTDTPNKNKPMSEDQKQKLKEAWVVRRTREKNGVSDETRAKLSEARKHFHERKQKESDFHPQ
jgi:hypothetical protein